MASIEEIVFTVSLDQKRYNTLRDPGRDFLFSYFQQNFLFTHGVYIRAMLAMDKQRTKPLVKIAEKNTDISYA